MGLLKKLVHFVTGGGTDVSINVENPTLSNPFNLNITAIPKQSTLNCRKVYLLIRCKEEKIQEFKPLDENNMTDNEKILSEMREWDSNITFSDEIIISGECKLNKDETYSWSTEINLNGAGEPSKNEKNHRIIWEVQAGIDVSGNDPDSGWIEIMVNP